MYEKLAISHLGRAGDRRIRSHRTQDRISGLKDTNIVHAPSLPLANMAETHNRAYVGSCSDMLTIPFSLVTTTLKW